MPLGTNYDWSGAIGDYESSLRKLYAALNKGPDFWDYLLKVGSMGAMFIPGLGPLAKFGIGSGMDLLGSMKRGQPYQPNWQRLLQLMMRTNPQDDWLKDLFQGQWQGGSGRY